jgi:antitoxin MazE
MPTSSKKQKAKKASSHNAEKSRAAFEQPQPDMVNEPTIEYTSKIRAIGNSKGVILNNQLLDIAGMKADMDILIQALNGLITIKPAETPVVVNTDRATWEKQLKAAIKAGDIPEGDLFEGLENEFDKNEW